MKVNSLTRSSLAIRREKRNLEAGGWQKTSDFDWRLTRGGLMDKRIAEVKISANGKQVWYRLEDDPYRVEYNADLYRGMYP